ncbi:1-acyl-sn-glycerol-3-phosphate acyltransferase [Bordetella sp. LUAb4]|uniref:lysophospholipid acyltransferase family protein n=1 Tax=Bordetella sp. LUAb4 TaxID=2843195 RepID=UPI001E61DABF|nr:lysophospholipid acyltransferase family protein [Bordetella sp. LUAb4]
MTRWQRFLRMAFAALVARPVVRLWLGVNVRHQERLPLRGPAIVAANHNSHLDICTLLSLFPLARVPDVQPAAAADYFMKGGPLTWIARDLVGIVPVVRGGVRGGSAGAGARNGNGTGERRDPLEGCYQALERGGILVIFPEGTRGEPEQMQALKSGIAHLARRFPDAPVVPLYMHGLGKSMPKGSFVPLPVFVDIFVGRALSWRADAQDDKAAFMQTLTDRFASLRLKARPTRDDAHDDVDQENA